MGYAHPDHLLQELTSVQLSEWEAYDILEPIGMEQQIMPLMQGRKKTMPQSVEEQKRILFSIRDVMKKRSRR